MFLVGLVGHVSLSRGGVFQLLVSCGLIIIFYFPFFYKYFLFTFILDLLDQNMDILVIIIIFVWS